MFVVFIIVAVVLYICIRLPNLKFLWGGPKFPDVFEIQKKLHEYSGISKDVYMRYITNMDNMCATMDPSYLYSAIHNISRIGMDSPEHSEDIAKLTDELARASEKHIMDYSLKNGKKFVPKYLNNMSMYTKEA